MAQGGHLYVHCTDTCDQDQIWLVLLLGLDRLVANDRLPCSLIFTNKRTWWFDWRARRLQLNLSQLNCSYIESVESWPPTFFCSIQRVWGENYRPQASVQQVYIVVTVNPLVVAMFRLSLECCLLVSHKPLQELVCFVFLSVLYSHVKLRPYAYISMGSECVFT